MRLSLFVLLSALVLAGCVQRNPLKVVVTRCPAVAVVGDTGTLTTFDGEGRSVDNVAYTATITDVRSTCEQGDRVITDMSVDFALSPGPKYDGEPVDLEYFVAVMRDNLVFVSKKSYPITLRASGDERTVITEDIRSIIPDVEQVRRYDYELLVGFQVTPEQAVFNMRR